MREDFLESIGEDFGHKFIDHIAMANRSIVYDLSWIFYFWDKNDLRFINVIINSNII
jgi:hypothetical protein